MKRFREVVFSATVPEDRNVIWIFPVTKDIDNDLKDENLPVEAFNEELYKVMIWGLNDWVNLLHGPISYIKAQLLSLIGDVPEGKTVIQIVGELENAVDLNIQEIQIINNALTVLEGIVSNKVDKVEGKELSDENFTSTYKNLLDTLTGGYMTFKDVVETLPESANNGDVYIIEQTVEEEPKYLGYIWSDVQNTFLPLGEVTNFSNFYTKDEVDSKITEALTPVTIIQKSKPLGVEYWRGHPLYPLLVDPLANSGNDVTLGGSRGVLNFYEMHAYFNIAFYRQSSKDVKLKIGGISGNEEITGNILFYNQGFTALTGGEGGTGNTYQLPSSDTDGGYSTLATIAPATTEKAGLMSPQDKETLNNVSGGNIPIGGIIMWSGKENTIDTTHWALCNGQTVNGHTTPDLQGRFVLGSGIYAGEDRNIAYKPDNTGGQIQVKLTSQQSGLPSHLHQTEFRYTAGRGLSQHAYDYFIKGAEGKYVSTTTAGGTDALQSHNNMPPYYVLAFIMRIA